MKRLGLAASGERLSVLCLGAHSDDIEIGAGATILGWIDRGVRLDVHWAVLSAIGPRADEARASAQQFLGNAARAVIDLAAFRDGFFPHQGADIKFWFEALRKRTSPDVILSHWRHDAHQDHREVSELTWNTFRDHAILEYEIPKWDGDSGRPNVYLPASKAADGAQDEASPRPFRLAALEGLVRRRDLHGPRALAWHGMPRPRRLRRSLPCTKTYAAMNE